MNNTALRAGAQSANNTHMVFANEEHEKFYYEKLEQARYQDCYHKALIYILGISEDTRNHFSQIYDIKSGFIKPECLHQGWQTSGSVRVVRLAFNLYTDGTPSVDDYKRKDEQIDECREYSVSDIFCCGYAIYFWQGIKLRYPEYCRKQRSMEEILAEMLVELMESLSSMNDNDRLSVAAYLESRGAWTTEIANQDTKEFGEYHLDVRYNTDTNEVIDIKA